MDNIYEQCVFEQNNPKSQVKYFTLGGMGIALLTLAIGALWLAFQQALWGLLVVTVGGFALGLYLWYKKDDAYLEFEYDYAMGDLEIIKISNNKRRKVLCSTACSEIEVIGKITAPNYPRYANMPNAKKYFATFKKSGEDLYFMLCLSKKGKVVIVFEPDEELLSYMKKHLRVSIDK